MKRFWLLLVLVCCCGCAAVRAENDWRDAVAVDMAVATMVDAPAPRPSPKPDRCERCKGTGVITHGDGHRTPCPDCRPDAGGPDAGGNVGGPLDTLRDAKELIRKGNALADRGKALLDAAERAGKITVDVRLPQPTPTLGRSCSDGICPVVPPSPDASTSPPTDTTTSQGDACPGGVCRPRLLWRFRR